ncbi:MAG: DUF1778 domain-containing protein [Gammaproteobacteria bacterium]|nr:DUF1778 domain-containing protein [Gammaproteobacteria bacterium]
MQKSEHTRSRPKCVRATSGKASPTRVTSRAASSRRGLVQKPNVRTKPARTKVTVPRARVIAPKLDRLDLRVNQDMKKLFARAADFLGGSITSFVLESAQLRATDIIQRFEQIQLSNADRDVLLAALANPPEPNAALRAAFEKYGHVNRK